MAIATRHLGTGCLPIHQLKPVGSAVVTSRSCKPLVRQASNRSRSADAPSSRHERLSYPHGEKLNNDQLLPDWLDMQKAGRLSASGLSL